MRADEGVRVGWVADNANLHGLLGDLVDSTTLGLEDLSVSLEEVRALHAGAPWASADKHGDISVLEADEWVGRWDDVGDAVVSAVLELHDEALQDLLSLRKLNELQDHLLVRSKHSTLSNEVAKECTNLTGGASDSDANRGLLQVLGDGWEVATEGLESANENVVLHCG